VEVATMTKNGPSLLTTMTKKGRHFFVVKRATPSGTAPGDTNLSDATAVLSLVCFETLSMPRNGRRVGGRVELNVS